MGNNKGNADAIIVLREMFNKFFRVPFNPNQLIYHYTTMTTLQSILHNKELWLSKADYMNDFTELQYFGTFMKKLIDEGRIKASQEIKDFVLAILNEFFVNERMANENSLFVLSLSQNPDSLALWYNYATNEGCNIGINTDTLSDLLMSRTSSGLGQWTGKVIYEPAIQMQICKYIVQCIHDLVQTDKVDIINSHRTISSIFLAAACFIKDPVFKLEEEFRMVIFTTEAIEKLAVKFRVARGSFIPYITFPIVTDDDKLIIDQITIGPRISIDTAEKGLEYYKKINNLTNIKIVKSDAPLRF
ncbi:hypothetical protein [Paenibacillus ehimensis]|uniref:DUF2971 domain-containing protein n=1 Tax=Paenibacillus ehimensis TaxID=79264 RepID=A0ABT8VH63_9BACL|nr:hypothetical protein [Paenibacillus ehimensis]MDO3680303.1 hypothetical protein [Paenibacillus ehimensis]